jgi:hypothetical protein
MSTHEDIAWKFRGGSFFDRSVGYRFFFCQKFAAHPAPWPAETLAAVSGLFLLITFCAAHPARGASQRRMKLSLLLSRVMNPLVIEATFYVVFSPSG